MCPYNQCGFVPNIINFSTPVVRCEWFFLFDNNPKTYCPMNLDELKHELETNMELTYEQYKELVELIDELELEKINAYCVPNE